MKKIPYILKYIFYFLLGVFIIIVTIVGITNYSTSPSNSRTWNEDQLVLPYYERQGENITIHNIRNFTYTSTQEYTKKYYDKTFDLSSIKKAWYVVEPFKGIPGSAHTFLTFEFDNNNFLSISIEIRKEKGESFSPVRGLFNQYELMYVVADENDVIKLRTNHRKDTVYLYPIKADKEAVRKLFLDMLTRVNTLEKNPEFYNTITNNCTTNIVRHIRAIAPGSIRLFNIQEILPEYSDKLAYELGFIDTTLSFEEARNYYRINERALKYADSKDFSIKIRE